MANTKLSTFRDLLPEFLAAVTNFSIQYNFGCLGIATAIMLSHNDMTGPHITPDFPEPMWARYFLLAIVFVGSIIGMICMGVLGDVIGIQRALIFTNALVVVGALSTALLSWGSAEHIWLVIGVSRFILGVGVGGGYPLSAARAAQGAKKGAGVEEGAKAFLWQSPGSLAPYIVALLLLKLPHEDGVTGLQFRILTGLGAIPALVVCWVASRDALRDTPPTVEQRPPARDVPELPASEKSSRDCGTLCLTMNNRAHWMALIGTAGTWFLFDVAIYSLMIFAPNIMKEVLGEGASLAAVAGHSLIFGVIGWMGACIGVYLLLSKHCSAKDLNTFGLIASACAFGAVAFSFSDRVNSSTFVFLMICQALFWLSVGPNIATYVLPIDAFPPDVRGTFHGISAACGKVGALVGVAIYPMLVAETSTQQAMLFMSAVCLLGAAMSHVFLKHCSTATDKESSALCKGRDEFPSYGTKI